MVKRDNNRPFLMNEIQKKKKNARCFAPRNINCVRCVRLHQLKQKLSAVRSESEVKHFTANAVTSVCFVQVQKSAASLL